MPTGDPHIPPLVREAKRLKQMLINESEIETMDDDMEEDKLDEEEEEEQDDIHEANTQENGIEIEEEIAQTFVAATSTQPSVGRATIPRSRSIARSGSISSATSAGRATTTPTPPPPLPSARSLNPSFRRVGTPLRSKGRTGLQDNNTSSLSYMEMLQQEMMQSRMDQQEELHEMRRQYLIERQEREKELDRQDAKRRQQEQAKEAERKAEREEREAERKAEREEREAQRKAEREEREAERRAERKSRQQFMEMIMMGVAGVLGATANFMDKKNKPKRKRGEDDDENDDD